MGPVRERREAGGCQGCADAGRSADGWHVGHREMEEAHPKWKDSGQRGEV